METDFPTPQQMHAFEHFISSFLSMLPRVAMFVALVIVSGYLVIFLARLVLRVLDTRRLLNQTKTFLELTPPAFTDSNPLAGEELFSVWHGLEEIRSTLDKLLQRRVVFTLEVVASREQGIRFIICIPESDRSRFEEDIISYLDGVRIQEVKDYLPSEQSMRTARVLEIKEKNATIH
jgi:hypothetical protein